MVDPLMQGTHGRSTQDDKLAPADANKSPTDYRPVMNNPLPLNRGPGFKALKSRGFFFNHGSTLRV